MPHTCLMWWLGESTNQGVREETQTWHLAICGWYTCQGSSCPIPALASLAFVKPAPLTLLCLSHLAFHFWFQRIANYSQLKSTGIINSPTCYKTENTSIWRRNHIFFFWFCKEFCHCWHEFFLCSATLIILFLGFKLVSITNVTRKGQRLMSFRWKFWRGPSFNCFQGSCD